MKSSAVEMGYYSSIKKRRFAKKNNGCKVQSKFMWLYWLRKRIEENHRGWVSWRPKAQRADRVWEKVLDVYWRARMRVIENGS